MKHEEMPKPTNTQITQECRHENRRAQHSPTRSQFLNHCFQRYQRKKKARWQSRMFAGNNEKGPQTENKMAKEGRDQLSTSRGSKRAT